MRSNSLITRNGILNLKGHQVNNQCAKKGHEVYLYELKVLFVDETKLNKEGFIIDHQLFDDAVQKSHVSSCEIIADEILDAIEKVLSENNLKCIGLKIKIQPAFVALDNSAYFQEYRCSKKKDLVIVMNL